MLLTLVAFTTVFVGVVDPFADISSAAYLAEITTAPTLWLAVHLVVAMAALCKLGGLLTIGQVLDGAGRSGLVRMANAFAVIGVVMLLVTMARDGYVHGFVAESWQATTDAAARADLEATFATSLRTSYGMEITSLIALLGFASIAYGTAMLGSREFPRWLGRLGIVQGSGAVVTGVYLYLTGPSDLGYGVLYPPFAILLPAVWLAVAAAKVWRLGGPARVDTAPRVESRELSGAAQS